MTPSLLLVGLAACNPPAWVSRGDDAGGPAPLAAGDSVRLVERDVEAPQVFSMADRGVWDGRPSLGGVWVAAPGVQDPERVIIRNTATGKFVIGALFRREREVTGPPLQLSSDAAEALGLAAGNPGPISVVALRKEEVPEGTPDAATAAAEAVEALPEVEVGGDVIAAAIAEVDGGADPVAAPAPSTSVEVAALPQETPVAAPPAPAVQPAPRSAPVAAAPTSRGTSALEKPFVQIGFFSQEQNARNTAEAMRQAGIVPTVVEDSLRGRTYWRVIVGPALTARDQAAVFRKTRDLGFGDAYAVRG